METYEAKPWWQSKTIWGALITLIALLAQTFFGIELSQDAQARLVQDATTIAAAIGSIIAIYGRATATKRLK